MPYKGLFGEGAATPAAQQQQERRAGESTCYVKRASRRSLAARRRVEAVYQQQTTKRGPLRRAADANRAAATRCVRRQSLASLREARWAVCHDTAERASRRRVFWSRQPHAARKEGDGDREQQVTQRSSTVPCAQIKQ